MAVASRSATRADAWLVARGLGGAGIAVHGSYAALLADKRVEAVYMPLPTAAHSEWVAAAAAAGKLAIILEKPCALNGEALRAMAAACASARCLLVDGVMFQHHERLPALLAALPRLGAPRRMTAAFSFAGDAEFFATNIRVQPDADPLGCVGDLGWYCARMALLVYGGPPAIARARAHKATAAGVPTDVSFTLEWPTLGAVADCHCSFSVAMRQWVEVAGEAGVLRCDDFVIPRTSGARSVAAFDLILGTRMADEHCRVVDAETVSHVTHDACQEAAMFDAVSAAVRAQDSAGVNAAAWAAKAASWTRLAIQTQDICDAVMASLRAGGKDVPVRQD